MSFPGEDYSSIAAIHRTGGFLSDAHWPVRKALCQAGAQLAVELGMKSIGTHIGFVPPSGEPKYQVMISRVREIAQIFSQRGLDLLMETGQERADALLQFVNDLSTPNVHINFDPANMILYGAGDPIAAVRTLGKHIRHVHVKDGTPSSSPGREWGEEVPFGTGQVNPKAFLDALHEGYRGPLAIEPRSGRGSGGGRSAKPSRALLSRHDHASVSVQTSPPARRRHSITRRERAEIRLVE